MGPKSHNPPPIQFFVTALNPRSMHPLSNHCWKFGELTWEIRRVFRGKRKVPHWFIVSRPCSSKASDSFQNSWQKFSKIYSWCAAQVTSVAINCSISFQKFSQVPHSNILNLILCEKEADVSQFTKAAFGGVPTVVVYPFYHGRQTSVNLQPFEHPSVRRESVLRILFTGLSLVFMFICFSYFCNL